jgi:hypothetical protein
MISSQGDAAERQKQRPARADATIDKPEIESGWMCHRTHNRTAVRAVFRNESAIGRRDVSTPLTEETRADGYNGG